MMTKTDDDVAKELAELRKLEAKIWKNNPSTPEDSKRDTGKRGSS